MLCPDYMIMMGHQGWTHVREGPLITDIAPSPLNVILYAIKVSSPQRCLLMSQTTTTEFVNHSPGHICTFIKIRVKWKLKL